MRTACLTLFFFAIGCGHSKSTQDVVVNKRAVYQIAVTDSGMRDGESTWITVSKEEWDRLAIGDVRYTGP